MAKIRKASMPCPFCDGFGCSGTDISGEAIDCNYCTEGRITTDRVKEMTDARLAQCGDLQVAHWLLREVLEKCKRLPASQREQIKSFIDPVSI